MNQYIQAKGGEFGKIIEFFKKEISSLRTGRANPNIFEAVQVPAYGTMNALNGVAAVNVVDGQCITIAPWDKNIIKDIEKAIIEADLGVSVVNEGIQIRVTVPRMTEENRKDLVKKLNERHEHFRISFRQLRDEIKTKIEQEEKAKVVTEDERFKYLKELDEEIAKQNNILKELRDKKETEIMTI